MKRKVFIILVIITLGSLFSGFAWWKVNTAPVSSDTTQIRIVIPKGSSAAKIGENLYAKGLIKNPFAFKVYVQLMGKQNLIKAGEFNLSADMDLLEVVDLLGKPPAQVWVTIPEGLRREEVVEKFVETFELESEMVNSFRKEFLSLTENKEGYLFPDTYLLPRDVSADKVVTLLLANFEKRFDSQLQKDGLKTGLTRSEIVTLASIIEKETKTNDERPIVAGVYFNRLEIGQPLQADATVQYVMGNQRCKNAVGKCDWWSPPLKVDLEVDSPYNTYKYAGIPPFPIANPGLASLIAVVYSTANDYFYYIHDSEGQIHFAKSYSEHLTNINNYLR